MDTDTLTAEQLLDGPPKTPEQLASRFRAALEELGERPGTLAERMHRLGDYRPPNTIVRGIQRMASGETRVSGEMQLILELFNREARRARYEADKLPWVQVTKGMLTAKTRDFTISLSEQTRGRWHISLMHKDGYSPPWPSWQPNLEAAKVRALLCVDEAVHDLQQIEEWNVEHG